jgi:hypothetical protein
MKNFTVSILLIAACQLVSAAGIEAINIDARFKCAGFSIDNNLDSHKPHIDFSTAYNPKSIIRRLQTFSSTTPSHSFNFLPFYFARKVDLHSRSSLEDSH